MTEALYDRLYRRLEPVRWNLSDFPFQEVDRGAVSRDTLEFLHVNCLLELSSLYATRMFLRDFRHDPDFCQFMSIWYFEEMRHYLVLREYLKVFGMEPDAGSLDRYDTELKPAPWAATLAMHWCGELRLGSWYFRWAELEKEPVLVSIFQHIGEDEFRHAQAYEEFMHRALEEDPKVLPVFLNTAKWMLVNPTGDKHPTTFGEGSEDGKAVVEHIEGFESLRKRVNVTMTPEHDQKLEQRVLKTLSRLTGRSLANRGDLVRFTREVASAELAS